MNGWHSPGPTAPPAASREPFSPLPSALARVRISHDTLRELALRRASAHDRSRADVAVQTRAPTRADSAVHREVGVRADLAAYADAGTCAGLTAHAAACDAHRLVTRA